MPCSSSSDELVHLLSSGNLSLVEGSAIVLRDLQKLSEALERFSGSLPSASLDKVREYLRRAISEASSDATVIVAAATLYVQLVFKVSLAYEELMLSTSTHHVSRILKDASGFKCPARCDATRSICTPSSHVPLSRFEAFLRAFVALICSKLNEFRSHGFTAIVMNTFGVLIRYARGSWSCSLLLKGIDAILNKCDLPVRTTIYNVMLPITRLCLPPQNQATLIQVVIRTAARERGSLRRASENPSSHLHHVSNIGEDGVAGVAEGYDEAEHSFSDASPHRLPVLRFLELSCIYVLDRANQRESLRSLIVQVLQSLRECDVLDFSSFVLKASRHPKGRIRLFAVELATEFVSRSQALSEFTICNRPTILDVLSQRVSDRVPSVRVKAIASLTDALKVLNPENEVEELNLFVHISDCVIERIGDPKSRVRKSAVDFLGWACKQILAMGLRVLDNGKECDWVTSLVKFAGHLKNRGSDAVSNVRIAAVFHMTQIVLSLSADMEAVLRHKLLSLWSDAVLTRSNDVDSRCRDLCLRAVHVVLFPWHGESSSRTEFTWETSPYSSQHLPDLFLSALGSEQNATAEHTKQFVHALSKKGSIGCDEIEFLNIRALRSPESEELIELRSGAWFVLAEISGFGNSELIRKALREETIKKEVLSFRNRSAFKIAGNVIGTTSLQSRKAFSESLDTALFTESIMTQTDTDCIIAGVEVLSLLQKDAGSDLINRSAQLVLTVKSEDDKRNENILSLIGSICVFFRLSEEPPETILTFVRALVSNYTMSSKLRALALTTLGKICLCQGQTQEGVSSFLSHENEVKTVGKAFNNIGESLTRRHISIFVHELQNATSAATKNNAVMVLCDLCRLYTAVAEPYISRLAEVLSDSSDFVRVQVLSSILSLLQEDYIKLRSGPILFQVAKCLLDPSETVREIAEYGLLRVAAPKNIAILATSFVELIFVLNECKECPMYNQSSSSPRAEIFDPRLSGSFEHRQRVYEVFLQGMSFEHRMRLPSRFRNDILSPIVDGKLPVDNLSVARVLTDTLSLLAYLQERFSSDRRRSEDDANVENSQVENMDTSADSEPSSSGDKAHVAKGMNLVNKVQLLQLRETTIPALLEIRHHLEELRSPLLKVLMKSLCSLLRPHRTNIKMLISDAVLRSEILHELNSRVDKKESRVQSRRKGSAAKQKIQKEPQSFGREPKERIVSPVTPGRGLSVPRTRRTQRKICVVHSDTEDDNLELENVDEYRESQLSRRIQGSPKLAAIATRCNSSSSKSPFTLNVDEKPSGFALALARIEDAAKARV